MPRAPLCSSGVSSPPGASLHMAFGGMVFAAQNFLAQPCARGVMAQSPWSRDHSPWQSALLCLVGSDWPRWRAVRTAAEDGVSLRLGLREEDRDSCLLPPEWSLLF